MNKKRHDTGDHRELHEPASGTRVSGGGTADLAMPLGRAWRGLLVFYGLALALNAVSLHRNNEHLPYGPVRSFWVAASGPVAQAAASLGLDRFRGLVADSAGAALNK